MRLSCSDTTAAALSSAEQSHCWVYLHLLLRRLDQLISILSCLELALVPDHQRAESPEPGLVVPPSPFLVFDSFLQGLQLRTSHIFLKRLSERSLSSTFTTGWRLRSFNQLTHTTTLQNFFVVLSIYSGRRQVMLHFCLTIKVCVPSEQAGIGHYRGSGSRWFCLGVVPVPTSPNHPSNS